MNVLGWAGFSRAVDRIFGEVSVDAYRCVNMINKSAGCTKCLDTCPSEAILMGQAGTGVLIDSDKCIKCGRCVAVCFNSVFTQKGRNDNQFWKSSLTDNKKKKLTITCDKADKKGDMSVGCLASISVSEIITIIRYSKVPFRFESGDCESCGLKNGCDIFMPRLKDVIDFLSQVEGVSISSDEYISVKGLTPKKISKDNINVSRRDFFKLGARNVAVTVADSLDMISPDKKGGKLLEKRDIGFQRRALSESVSDILFKFRYTVKTGANIPLGTVILSHEKCVGCGLCSKMCRNNALTGKPPMYDSKKCTACGLCVKSCRKDALHLTKTV